MKRDNDRSARRMLVRSQCQIGCRINRPDRQRPIGLSPDSSGFSDEDLVAERRSAGPVTELRVWDDCNDWQVTSQYLNDSLTVGN
ncbi:hypothetical protein F2P81_005557 [Scophthalmus maximus]|uniref:Uncharacterized protein n=1 Tax=Scophthalmus maximus TaxID=52904 RepID=A0A6A4T9Z8_SCOMX|nr:hypothetical protein F2P81_005557 [Scophthalmus maximus]